MTEEQIKDAIAELAKSHRGLETMRGLTRLLRHDGADGLDASGQKAVATLWAAAFGPLRGTTVELIREATNYHE